MPSTSPEKTPRNLEASEASRTPAWVDAPLSWENVPEALNDARGEKARSAGVIDTADAVRLSANRMRELPKSTDSVVCAVSRSGMRKNTRVRRKNGPSCYVVLPTEITELSVPYSSCTT